MEFSDQILRRRIAAMLPSHTGLPIGASPASQFQAVDVSDLPAIPDDERFLREAYRTILGRDCDVSGLVNYLGLLRRHVPRRVILLQIINSEEARQRGIRFTGIQEAAPASRARTRFLSARNSIGRVTAVIANVIQRVLLARLSSINHKLDCILREVTARTDGVAAKTDQSLRTLSEKLEAHVAHVSEDSRRCREELAAQSAQVQELRRSAELAWDLAASELRLLQVKLDAATLAHKTSATAAADAARESALAVIETIRANTSAVIEQQRRAYTLKDQSAHRDNQRGCAEDRVARIRPPVIFAGADILVTEVEGMILGVPGKEWRMAAYHAFRGPMEPGLTKYLRNVIKPGTVVVDVGANVGFYTLLAAKLLQGSGRVYSFEPAPHIYQILTENVQVNGFQELGMIHLHPLAVTDKAGKARLGIFHANGGHNHVFGGGQADDEIEVSTTSLDEILGTTESVDIVKIGAEGAGAHVFRGMTRILDRNPQIRIVLEFAPAHLRRTGINPCAFLDDIGSFGFGIRRIDGQNGDLLPVTREELIDASSVNLQLDRALGNGREV